MKVNRSKEILVEKEEEGPPIINLMDALRKSVARTGQDHGRHAPPRRVHAKRRRKTG